MPTTLSVLDCSATTGSITITFSESVKSDSLQLNNFTVYAPPKIPVPVLMSADPSHVWSLPAVVTNAPTVVLKANPADFNEGDFVLVTITDVAGLDPTDLSAQVPFSGTGRTVRDVEDAISYPILTEEISNRPSPVSTIPSGGGMVSGGGGSSSIGQLALRTVTDVLGWKVNTADPKGFIGALTQAFTLSDVEGHVESTWNPQMPAIQTDLGGSITGAQASLYMRAKEAVDQSSSLLDTLYPLDPEADPEYVKALREMVRSQMTQIVRELAVVGLPSVLRIDTYFDILLGQSPGDISAGKITITFNPDDVNGTLGKLRDTYGIQFAANPFNNSVADEVVITNFRVISDYLTSLLQSWISNRSFFFLQPNKPAFFGTQLVLISRQFNVIAETVNETRFTLDSVFIGPAERQALLLEFADPSLPPRFLESMLIEIEAFVGQEAPQLLKDGGKITVTNNILPVARALLNMVEEAHSPTNIDDLPDGFKTARVRNSLDDLQSQLERLVELVEQVEQAVPPAEDKLSVSSIIANGDPTSGLVTVQFLGQGFEPGVGARIASAIPTALGPGTFWSAQRVDLAFNPRQLNLNDGQPHDITLTNPNGDSVILQDAITIDTGGMVVVSPPFQLGVSSTKSSGVSRKPGRQKRSREVFVNAGGKQGWIATRPKGGSSSPSLAAPAPAAAAPALAAAAPAPAPATPAPVRAAPAPAAADTELAGKVTKLEEQLTSLHEKVDKLLKQLGKT